MSSIIKYGCKSGAVQYHLKFVPRKHAQNAGWQRERPSALRLQLVLTQQHPIAVTMHQSRLAYQPLSLSLYLEWLERSNSLLATPREEGGDSSHRSQDRELINGWSVTETGGVRGKVSGSTEAEWNAKRNCTLPLRRRRRKKKSHGDLVQTSQSMLRRHYTPCYIILDPDADITVCCIFKIAAFFFKCILLCSMSCQRRPTLQ